jgi:hypothetical protein
MKFFFLLLLISTPYVLADHHDHGHHGHDHHGHGHGAQKGPINKAQARVLGMDEIKVQIFQSKIDGSWANASFEKAELKEHDGHKEWIVTYTNEQGKKGKKLYLFFEENGDFLSSNFTGKH